MSFQGRQQRNRQSRCEWVAKGPSASSASSFPSQDASSSSVSAAPGHDADLSSGASRQDANQSSTAIRLGANQGSAAPRRDANFGFAKSYPAASRHNANLGSAAPKHDEKFSSAARRRDANSSSAAVSSKKFSVPDARRRGNNYAPKGQSGQADNQRKERERHNNQRERGANDPNLPQLVQEIQEKLIKGRVECMICYDMVRRSAPIWSCKSCFSIFHLNCIKKWARNPASVDLMAEKNQGSNWRCPGCQAVQLTPAKEIRYMCFCGKRLDPPSDLYLTPHSCGEPCGKSLEKERPSPGVSKEDLCPHMCVLQCHPGPCPPCKAFAPPRLCPCGKKSITTRCIDQKSVTTCGQRCDKLLDCQRHHCERVCHVGPCDSCQVLVNASCFCRKKAEVVLCGEMGVKGEVRAEDGVFSCNSPCEKKLRCNNHSCDEVCHPGPCGDCELMPGRINTCYCGKTSLKEERRNCLDPFPTCAQTCEKLLSCGLHRCKEVCHAGTCPPCSVLVAEKCRCGSSSRNVECHKTTGGEIFICDRSCGRKKSCGRHRCSDRCCPLSKQNTRLDREWDPHLCSFPCGKKLRCGQHMCNSLCHSGHCPPCLETIFTELTCACGRTSIPPPQPCGTPAPSCQFSCSVPQPCGHSANHSCHFGDCPPCSVPVAKECIGGHVVIRNIPCGSKDIRCNKLCGKTRQCGLHACARTCHPSPCDVTHGQGPRTSCGQTCGAPRRDCRHTCASACHPSTSCPDVRCEFPVTITCSCGRINATVACNAGGNDDVYRGDTVYEASIVQKLPVPLQPIDGADKKIPLGQRKLMCDDECAKSERKRLLADAFDIQTPNLDVLHTGEDHVMSELLADLFRRDPKWVLAVEDRCKYLVLSKTKGNLSGVKVHVFCPMLKEKRDALRFMAERWKLAVNYAGWEPKRFIAVHVTPKSRAPPRVIGLKGSSLVSACHPPVFDPLVDMDPRLVVSFPDLPRDADISALVLRFGGECELVWLNDKNAIAVFSDPARAATAMRRVDHGSMYHGAVVVPHNLGTTVTSSGNSAWEGAGIGGGGGKFATSTRSSWKKAVTQEPSWSGDSWGLGEQLDTSTDLDSSMWRGKDAPISASVNRWSVLNPETNPKLQSMKIESKEKQVGGSSSGVKANVGNLNEGDQDATNPNEDVAEIVDDWEKAYE